MFIHVQHQLRYTYDRPVFLEPSVVRLTPRQDATQWLLQHEMRCSPEPTGATWSIEPDGTDARILWFADMHDEFVITCDSQVQTLRVNPFDSIITDEASLTLPAAYPLALAAALSPMIEAGEQPEVAPWAAALARDAGEQTQPFLTRLTDEMHGTFRVIDRPHGDPFPPQRTFAERCGSCRDMAMLFIAACRSQNLAARFVSGYSLNAPPESSAHELHAWAEVYLPGGGWRGFDPSLGLAVADSHVALASGPDHQLAAPFTGTYRGTGATSRLDYEISLRAAETAPELSSTERSR